MLSAHISVNQLQITCTQTHTIKDEECSSVCMLALLFHTCFLSYQRKTHNFQKCLFCGFISIPQVLLHTQAVPSLVFQRTLRDLYYRIGAVQSSPFSSFEYLRSSTKMQKRSEQICRDIKFEATFSFNTLILLPCALKQPTLPSKYIAGQKLLGLYTDAHIIFT